MDISCINTSENEYFLVENHNLNDFFDTRLSDLKANVRPLKSVIDNNCDLLTELTDNSENIEFNIEDQELLGKTDINNIEEANQ